MESTGGQLLLALLLLVGLFLAIAAGIALMLWMPLTARGSHGDRGSGRAD